MHPIRTLQALKTRVPGLAAARFEFAGYDIVYRVRMEDGSSGHSLAAVHDVVSKGRTMGVRSRIEPWVAGPDLDETYSGFSEEELELLALSNPTASGVSNAVAQAFDQVLHVETRTISAGVVGVDIDVKRALTPAESMHIRSFAIACCGSPGVSVELTHAVEASSSPVGSTSRGGSRFDPVVVAATRDDEDLFADARRSDFAAGLEARPGLSLFLPVGGTALDLRWFLPLYEFAYFPLEAYHDGRDAYGITWADACSLIRAGRLVPVLGRRATEYDQGQVREAMECGSPVLHRRLGASIAKSLLDANPLWRIARIDAGLAAGVLSETRRELGGVGADSIVTRAATEWSDFQEAGLHGFRTLAFDQPGLLPLHFGPGALAARLLRAVHGDQAPDLEANFTGLHLTQSASLGAVCLPETDPTLYRLYELAALAAGARELRPGDAPLRELPVVAEMDQILDSLAVTIDPSVPVSEWIERMEPEVVEFRRSLEEAFRSDDPRTREWVRQRAANLEWDFAKLEARRAAVSQNVKRFELLGVASDALAWLADSTFPFAGTLIGVGLKHTLPAVWDALGTNPRVASARDVLESAGIGVSSGSIQLHRATRTLLAAAARD